MPNRTAIIILKGKKKNLLEWYFLCVCVRVCSNEASADMDKNSATNSTDFSIINKLAPLCRIASADVLIIFAASVPFKRCVLVCVCGLRRIMYHNRGLLTSHKKYLIRTKKSYFSWIDKVYAEPPSRNWKKVLASYKSTRRRRRRSRLLKLI